MTRYYFKCPNCGKEITPWDENEDTGILTCPHCKSRYHHGLIPEDSHSDFNPQTVWEGALDKAIQLQKDVESAFSKKTGEYNPTSIMIVQQYVKELRQEGKPKPIGRCLVKEECNQYKREGITSNCIGCGSLKLRQEGKGE